MNKTLIIVLVLIVVLGGAYFFMGQNYKVEAPVVEQETDDGAVPVDNGVISNTMPALGNEDVNEMLVGGDAVAVKEFTVEGGKFYFKPNTMTVKKGDTVKITFKNVDGFHDFKLDGFNVATTQFQSPGEQTVEFVADKVGNFEYYCSVGQHKAMGMKGTLTVTE